MTDNTQDAHLFSEGWLFAALLEMVVAHCGTGQEGHVKSFGWAANAQAMRLLAEAGYVDITGSHGDEIEASVSASGRELIAHARRDRQVHRVEDLPEDIIEQIARTEMDPRHSHLNDLLKDRTS